MRDERILMILIFASFFLRELWTLFPENNNLIKPFPFSQQEIVFRTYIWMMCGYVMPCLFGFVLSEYSSPKAQLFFDAFFVLAILEFVEYLLNYNQYWFKIQGIGVNITNIRYVILSGIILFKLITWKT